MTSCPTPPELEGSPNSDSAVAFTSVLLCASIYLGCDCLIDFYNFIDSNHRAYTTDILTWA